MAAASIGLAGCIGDDGGDGADGEPTRTETETATATTTEDQETTTTSDSQTETGSEVQTTMASGDGPTVAVRSHPDLGDVLVGPDGLTLYMFDQDTEGEAASSCSGGCADIWPPLTVDGSASAGDAVTAPLETFEREDGSTQVMAGGWPLYYYASDSEPGDVTGHGSNDVWWVLDPDGEPVRSSGSGTTTSGDGGIY
jgi:predicted lipoprotein with Yx(FWY)xxD motif